MQFKIGNTDYSNRIVAGTYEMNRADVFTSWNDANGVEHRQKTRDQITGSFDMWFREISEYNAFLANIASNKATNLTIPITLTVNQPNSDVTGNFYLEFKAIRDRKGDWSDYMHRFSVSVKES